MSRVRTFVRLAAWLGLAATAQLGCSSSGPAACTDCGDAAPDTASDVGCTTSAECAAGRTCCAGLCIDPQTDPEHCGICGNACFAPGIGNAACVAGSCRLDCAAGLGDCDLLSSNGCETSLGSDPNNCGACGNICLYANADPGCEAGTCALQACKTGFGDCNGDPKDGCEIDLDDDPAHCADCATACTAAPNTEPTCIARKCEPGPCKTGFADCDGDPANGCEVDLFADALHCGTCARACPALPNAATACTGAACAIATCDAGFADCDHSVWSGCEVELATNVRHCNACGNACPAIAHGTAGCAAGACGVGACDAGYADCDGDPANGCEVNLANDAANCAACGNACPPVSNGAAVCSGFVCGISSCAAPFADCFGGAADGCETNLSSSVDHCGGCATVCPAIAHGTRACASGSCGIGACTPGYGNCNASIADGCEITFASDVNNCGSCGNVCPTPANGVAGCATGSCKLAVCNAGFSDCDGNAANGCEFNTSVDPNNCGGCGVKCGSGTCVASKCQCSKNVLLIADDGAAGTTTLKTALGAAGYTVTQTTVPSYQYNGTNPALTGFGAVVLLAGGPGTASSLTDMPAGGQTAIANFVAAGNGLVLTEWAAFHVSAGRWTTLAPLVLLTRSVAYTGQVTYKVDPAFTSHPIWAGLPASFTLASTSNVGVTKIAANVTRVAGSPEAIDAVALRDAPSGRVVHLAHAGNYSPAGWTNVNLQKLVGNSVGWAARCQ